MSRSRRHTPIIGICANAKASERRDKEIWHRGYRRTSKQRVKLGLEPVHFREYSDVYDFSKDGKVWVGSGGWWRRDPKKAMRK